MAKAERALASDETPVGCVFVRDDKIIAQGMNDTNRSLNVRHLPPQRMNIARTKTDKVIFSGHTPRRVHSPRRAFHPRAWVKSHRCRHLCYGRTVHHVCFHVAAVWHQVRVLWVLERQVWRNGRRVEHTFRVSLSSVHSAVAHRILSASIDPPYPAYGGLFREEAIMLLRRFYVQENEKGKFAACVTGFKVLH